MVPEAGDPNLREVLREPFRVMYEIHPMELRILVVGRMERASIAPEDLSEGGTGGKPLSESGGLEVKLSSCSVRVV